MCFTLVNTPDPIIEQTAFATLGQIVVLMFERVKQIDYKSISITKSKSNDGSVLMSPEISESMNTTNDNNKSFYKSSFRDIYYLFQVN